MIKNKLSESWIFLIIIMIIFFFMNYKAVNERAEFDRNIIELRHQIEQDSLQYEIRKLQRYRDSVELYELNWNNIDHWLDRYNIEHKDIVKQQIFLETGNLSSDICINNKNLFGMRYPRVRETTAIGTRKAHAEYNNFVESIKDYALWQDNMYSGERDYYAFLTRVGYAECKTYINKLKYIERNVEI